MSANGLPKVAMVAHEISGKMGIPWAALMGLQPDVLQWDRDP